MLLGSVLLWTLLILLGLLLLVLLLVLFVPFTFYARADTNLAADDWEEELSGTFQGKFRLRWGLATVSGTAAGQWLQFERVEVRLMGLRLDGGKHKKHRGKSNLAQKEPGKQGASGGRSQDGSRKKARAWLHPELLWAVAKEALSLPVKVWRSLGVRLSGDLTYGFSDPSLTGFCEALRWGTRVSLPVKLNPDFLRPCLIGWASVGGRVFGYRLVAIGWRVLRRPVIWNHLAGQIRFRPLRKLLLQGGT